MLLVHGLGASAHYWDNVLAAVHGHEVIAPDLLGFGRSPAPPDVTYDVACHLTGLEQFVADGMVVVGHSTGALLAAALAAAHPQEVRGLLLVGLPAFPDAATARAEVGRLGMLARLTVEERLAGRLLCNAMCRLRPVAIAAAPLLVRGLPREVAADGARHTWSSYSRTLRHVVIAHRVSGDLHHVAAPITVLHGREDRTAPLHHVHELVDELRSAGRNAQLDVVDGDHHLPVRQPDLVAAAIAAAQGPT